MILLKSLAVALAFSIAGNSYAQALSTPPSMQREAGRVECDEKNETCSYLVQNLTAQELIAKLNANLFPGGFISNEEGKLVADNFKKINFYFKDPLFLAKFISFIPLLDVLEDFVPSNMVQLTTEIFAMTESASTEFQARLTSSGAASPVNTLATDVMSALMGAGAAALPIELGTNLLSSILGSKKIKEDSTTVSKVTQLITNLAPITYSQTTSFFISPKGSGQVLKEQKAGLEITGTVSIKGSDSDQVIIKDFGLKYGVATPMSSDVDERINLLSIGDPQLVLIKGTSRIAISSSTTEDSHKKEYSLISFEKNKTKKLSKLLIVTTAEAVNFDEYVADLKKSRNLDLFGKFSEESIAKFPNDEVSLEEVLKHVKPYSFFTTSGDRILGFKLDKTYARASNINKSIQVTVKTGMFKKGVAPTYKVQNLMLTGFKFEPLSSKDLEKSIVKINVSFKVFSQNNTSVNKVLNYNPLTNEFIEE